MVTVLSPEELEARLHGEEAAPVEVLPPSRYIKPLVDRAKSLIKSVSAEEGITLGLVDIDIYTGGFRPKQMILVAGFSHSGKTQLINMMVLKNSDKVILFFSMDDPTEMILAKLFSMANNIGAEEVERLIREGDTEIREQILEFTRNNLSNLFVVDDSLSIEGMRSAVEELRARTGRIDAVVIDYLESIPGARIDSEGGAGVKQLAQNLKTWASDPTTDYPVIVVHQNSRGKGAPGKPVTMLSLAYGGEQQATIGIGVWRKCMDEDLEEHEIDRHRDSITVNVFKNKQPGRKFFIEGQDYRMESKTGLITPRTAAAAAVNVVKRAFSATPIDGLGEYD